MQLWRIEMSRTDNSEGVHKCSSTIKNDATETARKTFQERVRMSSDHTSRIVKATGVLSREVVIE